MKTIIFLFTLLLASSMIPVRKQSAQNKKGESFANQVSLKNEKTPDGRPKILFLISAEKGKTARPASLWWSYKQTDIVRPGC